jgi:hypothetical protein
MNDLKCYAEEFTSKKKQVSDTKWVADGFVTYLLASMIAYLVYTLNENRFENAGLLAVGGTLAMFVFISQSEKRAGVVMWLLTKLFVVAWLVLEVASIAGSYMSASNGTELNQHRENKENAQIKIAEFRQEKIDIQNSNVSPASKIYRKSEINTKIENLENESRLIISSNEGKYFSDLSKLTGINNIGQIYQITLSALLVLAGSMLVSLRNGVWCNFTLNQHLKQAAKTMEIMQGCEEVKKDVIKSVSLPDLKTQGTQKDEPQARKTITGNIEQAKAWVNGHKDGEKLSAKALRKATGTSSASQQNVVIRELKKAGVITKIMNGKVPNYLKAEPKQAVLSQFEKTKNFLNIVKK